MQQMRAWETILMPASSESKTNTEKSFFLSKNVFIPPCFIPKILSKKIDAMTY